MYIVRNKLIITAVLALTGSIIALVGDYYRSSILILGLLLVILSPIISYIIVYLWYRWRVKE